MHKFLIALLLLVSVGFANAQETQKEEDILKFLNINGGREASEMMLNQVFEAFKKLKSDVPPSFWEKARKKFTVDELQADLVPLYSDLFTHQEILDLIAFYESETGKKMANLTGEITKRSMQIGEIYGRKLAEGLLKEIEDAGY
jgi:hypothetical protein